MDVLIRNVRVIDYVANIDMCDDVLLTEGRIDIAQSPRHRALVIDGRGLMLLPGLVDLHVHFRQPGFIHKEDIASGIQAALAGGVTSALVMPNTMPPIDEKKKVAFQLRRALPHGFDLMVAGAASMGLLGQNPTDIGALKEAGVKAVTDDGKPILDDGLMEEIFRRCRRHDVVFMQHAEDTAISHCAAINEGKLSKKFDMVGQPSCAESSVVARDIGLAKKLNARYHVLHLSCHDSLKLVRAAKRDKASITCEVSPHHLLLYECDVRALNTNRKMNPPLRSKDDLSKLIDGLEDGSVDAVASDHAPHSAKEKRQSFTTAPFGVVGLESAFLVLLTLVKKRRLSLRRAIEAMTIGPAQVLKEPYRIGTMLGERALKNAVLIDPDHNEVFSERRLAGRSKNSPFVGMELYGKVVATFLNGNLTAPERFFNDRFYWSN